MSHHDRLTKDDWMRAARRALLSGGVDAVRVEPLAETLGVTKGSFYWHFSDRPALLEALLAEWEAELDEALAALPVATGPAAVQALLEFLAPRLDASERGELPSDAAMFAWASGDRAVAARVRAAESKRVAFVQRVVNDDAIGEFLYLAYVGFLTRRRRARATAASFAVFANVAERIVSRLSKPSSEIPRRKLRRISS